jgi:hypothetical protein
MKQAMEQKHEEREKPSLVRRIVDTVVGIGIIAMVGFLKWKAGLGDLYFGIGLLLGGTFVSKSLVADFGQSILEKLKK